ncbi:transposase [Paracoccus litorisediminis]|uniref:transposase n=1 Tax=Paracoccus litorisediminis TaxID=2006130 RepID=UPI001B8BBE42|nr:transposase [Paracoccus litorisediminis]
MRRATQASVAQELGITSSQLKGWRLELEAAGSAEAVRRQKAEPAELAELRRENRRLKEEVNGRRNHERETRLHRRPVRPSRNPKC